jgi:hypothetical protein
MKTSLNPTSFSSSASRRPSAPKLSGSHLRTHQTIFRHPASHNLQWRAIYALFRRLGRVETEPNGNLKVTLNGQNLVLHPSRTKDVAETGELLGLRHFLEKSASIESSKMESEQRWLLVIDHRERKNPKILRGEK